MIGKTCNFHVRKFVELNFVEIGKLRGMIESGGVGEVIGSVMALALKIALIT